MRLVFHKPYCEAEGSALALIPGKDLRSPGKGQRAHRGALDAFLKMAEAARADGVSLVVLSSFRARAEQAELFRKGEEKHGKGNAILWLAPPGYSEHHTGLAFDLADRERPEADDEPLFETTQAFPWLLAHGGRFGFELSFPKGNWQGIGYEPWHWRFVGEESCRKIFHPPFFKKMGNLVMALSNGLRLRLGF